jgi:hypothetical protein
LIASARRMLSPSRMKRAKSNPFLVSEKKAT